MPADHAWAVFLGRSVWFLLEGFVCKSTALIQVRLGPFSKYLKVQVIIILKRSNSNVAEGI